MKTHNEDPDLYDDYTTADIVIDPNAPIAPKQYPYLFVFYLFFLPALIPIYVVRWISRRDHKERSL